jgi:hypothetical protein
MVYQRCVRRNRGKDAARKVFSATKQLRRDGRVSYHLYLAHAHMEAYTNHDQETARRWGFGGWGA